MESIIGLDCGATHTKICVWKSDRLEYEDWNWPGMNMDLIEDHKYQEDFKKRLSEIEKYNNFHWVIALSGIDNQAECLEAERWWRRFLTANGVQFSSLHILSDIDLVLWAGSSSGVGIGLIAGTGSNCLGVSDNKKRIKVGGMSHLMSDEGGGFAIGWKCLRLVTKMSDGRMPKTALFKKVLDLYGKKDIVDLKNHLLGTTSFKSEIAKVSPIVLQAASDGDQDALELVDNEILELVYMIEAANRQLSSTKQYPVYVAGSLFKNPYFIDKFNELLHLSYPSQSVIAVKPIEGIRNFWNSTKF